MRYRPPKQLHASLYMSNKTSKSDSKVIEEAKTGKSASNKKACRAKK